MLATLLSLCLAALPVQAAAPTRWLAPGGDGAGSARSFARPLRQLPEVAWSWSAAGPIEGEVSTWDGSVLLSVFEASGRRGLVLLDLASGTPLLNETLRASTPLTPTLDGDAICVRPSVERVDLYRLREGRIGRPRSIRAKHSISAPLLVEGQLYLRLDDTLQRFELNTSQPSWSAELPGVARGRPALSGERLFALCYDENGEAQLAMLERKSGRLLASLPVGNHGGQIPALDASASLHVSSQRVFIHYPLPLKTADGTSYNYGSLALQGDGFANAPVQLHAYHSAPVTYKSGWIAAEGIESLEWLRISQERGTWSVDALANGNTQPQLAASRSAAALTGDVIYFGGLAADLASDRILWKRRPALFRPTPFDGGLLVIEEPNKLSALREPGALRSSDATSAALEIERLEAERAEQMADLAQRSIRLGDGALTRRWIDLAQQLGASAKLLGPAFRAMDRIAENSKPADPAGNNYRALQREAAALLARPAIELGKLAALAEGGAQRALLRATLERDALQAQALAQVVDLLPEGAPRTQPLPALEWLDLLDVTARVALSITGLKSSDADRLLLAKQRDGWRSDLSGFRSERLFIIAPSDQIGAVARCLETGELLCTLLEELFQAEPADAGAALEPLCILLYPSREEYIAQSTKAHNAPEAALGWTAGHYSSLENLSRLFVPKQHDSIQALLEVYAHELTHHWLAARSPFAAREGQREAPFWIVEGFASLISEFELDPLNQRWQARNPRARSLDTLRALPPKELLPWDLVLSLDHSGFVRLSTRAQLSIPLSWTLGLNAELSHNHLYYSQASALAQTLYNGSPQTKTQLLDYVRAWYSRDASALDAAKCFGASPETLGQRTLDYARRNSL